MKRNLNQAGYTLHELIYTIVGLGVIAVIIFVIVHFVIKYW